MRIALVAGEASGDMLAAGLMGAIRSRLPQAIFEGVAGPSMKSAGCEALAESGALAVMGLAEPLTAMPKLLGLRRSLLGRWSRNPPDVFVGIGAPDFNLRLEAALRARGIRTVHYVSPSVWAWRQWRVKKIARAADKVLCLLPFETAFYDERGIAAEFVGHPMADRTVPTADRAAARGLLGIKSRTVLAVLPGSRMSEVSRLGPVFARACARLAKHDGELGFVAPMVSERICNTFAGYLDAEKLRDRFLLVSGNADRAMIAADVALLASGTAALQAALLGRPMVAAYRLAPLTYAIVKAFRLIKVPYITLPNLLTDTPLVPEFIQGAATPRALAESVRGLLADRQRRAAIARGFCPLRAALARGANERAADAVLALAMARGGVASSRT